MKKALVSLVEIGRVCDVVEVGSEFEVTRDFQWVDCPDNVTSSYRYNAETGEFTAYNPLAMPGFAEEGYKVARQIAYKSVGEQMDMMFKELAATGTISQDGPWATHVAMVKETIPKDDPEAVMAWNIKHAETITELLAAQPTSIIAPPTPDFLP